MKLLILGFDALGYEPYKEFKLEDYQLFPLHSPDPFTPIAWVSVYTGSPKGRHGVKSLDWKPWLESGGFSQTETCFWDILNKEGLTVELLNLPCTYPPRAVDRYMVSGFPLIADNFPCAQKFTYPEHIEEKLPKGYVEAVDMIHWKRTYSHEDWVNYIKGMPVKTLLERIKSDADLLIDTFLNLHSNKADLGFIQFSFLDRTGHLGHGYHESLELVNYTIQRLETALQPENVLIISDHGEALHPQGHNKMGVFCFKGQLKPASTVDKVEKSILEVFNLCDINSTGTKFSI